MTPRLPEDETEGTDPPGSPAPPVEDPPEEGPPGASGEDPPPPFEPDVPRPVSRAA